MQSVTTLVCDKTTPDYPRRSLMRGMAMHSHAQVSQFVKEQRAAEILGLSVKTLRGWRLRGNGPRYAKLGRSVRYAICDLEDFAASCIRKSTSG